ncbi:complex I 51 kDa subunit family protein [Miniphocaeibacter massiliensis]|uniref:complex I 51 kDa subunit family protein n=1 Tax=Miniphocaeibacter massiliensis TaxID=2041841 RepID=UPI000C1BF7B0|nr:NADH-ubiquinone oxidoreductase-F iron-sulfur binding region domain-containing protein [Miniphocaeibacter massiliensis]
MSKTIKLITGTVDKSYKHSVEDYKSNRGFNALHRAINMDKEDIIQEVIDSKLLGRGGAAFPTGLKWKYLNNIEGEPKYIVCNADEGEPGTFKDRLFMKRDPLIVIEGMLIAGYVFNSKEGYIYIRGEYRGLFEGFKLALKNAKQAGYLGKNILGIEEFDFDIKIISGAGAYVCGENSTLLNSIEGQAGRPRVKPPRLAEVGLFGQPTLVNNVETFANIPIILDRGPEYYRSVGTEESGGSLIICMSGHAKNKHYAEIPVGTNLKDIIYDEELAGGTSTGRPVKFVHIGGQSGPLAFPEQFDISFDHITLKKEGLAIGTGAIVIADDSVCLVDYLKKVFEFFIHESCGKCNPCREGNQQMYAILDKFSKGEGSEKDLEILKNLAYAMEQASFCGLGQAAPTALMSALKHREEEFLAHIDKNCSKCFK